MADRAELNRLVLLQLGVLDATEAPEAEDAVDVDLHSLSKMEQLYADGLLPFDIEGAIPRKYLLPLACLVSVELIDVYAAHARAATLAAAAERSQKVLYRFAARPYSGAVVPSEYF